MAKDLDNSHRGKHIIIKSMGNCSLRLVLIVYMSTSPSGERGMVSGERGEVAPETTGGGD